MNAFGIIPGAATAGAVGGAAGSASGSPAANGSTSGFAGMLVQVIGGGATESSQTASQGLPVGMLGLMGLLGQTVGESDTAELVNLLNGLNEQLGKLDANAEWPAELQEQLAALLLLIQNLLHAPIGSLAQGTDVETGMTGVPAAADEAQTGQPQQQTASAMQTILQALRQSVQQLTDRLVQGETLPIQQTALTEPLRQALQALRSFNDSQQTAKQAGPAEVREGMRAEVNVNSPSNPSRNGGTERVPATEGMKVETFVRQSALPLRNPVWSFQANATADAGQTSIAQAGLAAESAEPGSPSGAVPVWTMLKGDAAVLPTSGQANAPATAQVPVQQFAEQMGKFLVKQFALTQGDGVSEAKISLRPEHLGQVDIKLVIQNGLLTAKFMAETGAARDLLEAQMSQLRTALQGQGLQVEKVEVVQQSSTGAASFFQQHERQQNSGQSNGRNGNRQAGTSYDDIAEFELELERTAYLRESGFGSSLNVTA